MFLIVPRVRIACRSVRRDLNVVDEDAHVLRTEGEQAGRPLPVRRPMLVLDRPVLGFRIVLLPDLSTDHAGPVLADIDARQHGVPCVWLPPEWHRVADSLLRGID